MGEFYRVDPEQVRSLSQAFAGQQDVPTRSASGLGQSGSVQTGDPALDGELQQLLGQLTQALTALQDALSQDASGLTETAQSYIRADQSVVASLQQVRAGMSSGARAVAGTSGSSLGIVDKLSGTA